MDSGRKFHKKFRRVALEVGLRECKLARSSYVYEIDGDIKVFMGAHVDDLLWAAKQGYEYIMDKLLAQFEVKEIHEGSYKFCGREFNQTEDFSITISCKENTEGILPISVNRNGRSEDGTATESEISQLRSVI